MYVSNLTSQVEENVVMVLMLTMIIQIRTMTLKIAFVVNMLTFQVLLVLQIVKSTEKISLSINANSVAR